MCVSCVRVFFVSLCPSPCSVSSSYCVSSCVSDNFSVSSVSCVSYVVVCFRFLITSLFLCVPAYLFFRFTMFIMITGIGVLFVFAICFRGLVTRCIVMFSLLPVFF